MAKVHVTCRFCGYRLPPNAVVVNAGGDVGRVHQYCFEVWDDQEHALAGSLVMGTEVSHLVREVCRG